MANFIIAILVTIIVGFIFYNIGFKNGVKSSNIAFNYMLDNNLKRFVSRVDPTDPTDTDGQE